jgi:hypothetical protein
MTRALRTPRRAAVAFLLLVSVVGVPAGVLGQTGDDVTESGTASAILSQDGWWNRAQGRQEPEPETPIRPVIGGTVPAPSTVPADGLGVGAVLGDADKVAAIGFVLDAPLDAFVDRLVLTVKESAAANANANATAAAIVACPITDFWASAKNGDFVNRPGCDDGQSVPGTRGPDGTWTFDLASMGSGWLDGTLSQNGVLLKEAVEPPVSFQVSFGDLTTDTVQIDFAASGGGFSGSSDFFDDSFLTETPSESTSDSGFALDDQPSTFDSGTTFDAGDSSFATTPAAPTEAVASPAEEASRPLTPVSGVAPLAEVELFGNLPVAALVFLALLVAGAALFLSLVLGPLTAPTPAAVRRGGVSQALAAREASDRR